MNARRVLRIAALPLLAVAVLSGCSDEEIVAPQPLPDIVDTAVAAGTFQTLVAAVTAAELVETLKSPGPFTVFAPTDAAFEALPEGTVDSLLLPENRDQLVAILTYHVVSGSFFSGDVLAAGELTTVQGQNLIVDAANARVNSSNLIALDIEASNGVIHVIDSVLLPQ